MSEYVRFKIAYLMLPNGSVPETFAMSADDPHIDEKIKRFLKRWTDMGIDAKAGFVEAQCIPGMP